MRLKSSPYSLSLERPMLVLDAKCDHGHEKGKIRAEERQFRVMVNRKFRAGDITYKNDYHFSSYSNLSHSQHYIFHTN